MKNVDKILDSVQKNSPWENATEKLLLNGTTNIPVPRASELSPNTTRMLLNGTNKFPVSQLTCEDITLTCDDVQEENHGYVVVDFTVYDNK